MPLITSFWSLFMSLSPSVIFESYMISAEDCGTFLYGCVHVTVTPYSFPWTVPEKRTVVTPRNPLKKEVSRSGWGYDFQSHHSFWWYAVISPCLLNSVCKNTFTHIESTRAIIFKYLLYICQGPFRRQNQTRQKNHV